MSLCLSDIARAIDATLSSEVSGVEIERVARLSQAGQGDISFLASAHYQRDLSRTRASAVILNAEHAAQCPVPSLVVTNPYLAYAKVARLLHPVPVLEPGIHPSAVVDPTATIDPNACIQAQVVIGKNVRVSSGVTLGPGCSIGDDCEIGADSRLLAKVVLGHGVRLGARNLIQPGAVIGSDGFGFVNGDGRWLRIPQVGSVSIGDDCEIGANTTIDRGALEDTVIEDGVIIDNQVHIAHNVHIGAHTAIAGCVGIAGSAHIGRHCAIGGGAGILGHLQIVDGVTITAMTLVTRTITEKGVYSSGVPHAPARLWNKQLASLRRLVKR
ncbi:UDP-3-O-[3-hydroxymyristoyl] glucosamine N-acyltransferase [Ectothiorhodosinus mongolicus]|uniref:UDP-3-O-acylglucosamine N-acyltransferase n=1 Tax=Ectothiorhodosinus mongolicus TaxID=233100 RepID=A0A1R3VQP1_9GAMM|nr:UDP-3-O-(3-hydroxymyristoyl)glucosamine N-acyltransferase [Ectothiorhodosinus mongolicus]ULX56358.1 UDP-3-O-(3-hydroxymyristoyl)glucosamine N-acyltransferase [Ectothiorhodosinus mongolicus]SIT65873.1 UDP-3-O-[3-hydroxymyristoyl] glucosamine N-acyltransferase [Ectothiorhodosinus mongolicus]